jgi:pimeloyl-ACP methyl ester carboxylesterase
LGTHKLYTVVVGGVAIDGVEVLRRIVADSLLSVSRNASAASTSARVSWSEAACSAVFPSTRLTPTYPPSFRSPCGAMEDSFYLATGKQLWDSSLITAPTLVLVSERDFWSRPEDRENLAADLVHSPRVQVVVIPGATHFVHLDRPDRGRNLLLSAIKTFLTD